MGETVVYTKYCSPCRLEDDLARDAKVSEEARRRAEEEITKRLNRVIPRLYQRAEITDLPDALRDTVRNLDGGKGMYLFGAVGCGKTHSLCAIAKHYIRCGIKSVVFWNWEHFLKTHRAKGADGYGVADKFLVDTAAAEILLIDDIGGNSKEASDDELEKLYLVFNNRVSNCLPTFFSSNRNPEEIGELYDQRIVSRIHGHCEIIGLEGRDRRIEKMLF